MQDSIIRIIGVICITAVIFGIRAIYRLIRNKITGNNPEAFDPDTDVHRSHEEERTEFCWFCGKYEPNVAYLQMRRVTVDFVTRTTKTAQVPIYCCNDCLDKYLEKRIWGFVIGALVIFGMIFAVLWFWFPYTTTPAPDTLPREAVVVIISLLFTALTSMIVLPRWPFPYRKKVWQHPVVSQFHKNGYLDTQLNRNPQDQ